MSATLPVDVGFYWGSSIQQNQAGGDRYAHHQWGTSGATQSPQIHEFFMGINSEMLGGEATGPSEYGASDRGVVSFLSLTYATEFSPTRLTEAPASRPLKPCQHPQGSHPRRRRIRQQRFHAGRILVVYHRRQARMVEEQFLLPT